MLITCIVEWKKKKNCWGNKTLLMTTPHEWWHTSHTFGTNRCFFFVRCNVFQRMLRELVFALFYVSSDHLPQNTHKHTQFTHLCVNQPFWWTQQGNAIYIRLLFKWQGTPHALKHHIYIYIFFELIKNCRFHFWHAVREIPYAYIFDLQMPWIRNFLRNRMNWLTKVYPDRNELIEDHILYFH